MQLFLGLRNGQIQIDVRLTVTTTAILFLLFFCLDTRYCMSADYATLLPADDFFRKIIDQLNFRKWFVTHNDCFLSKVVVTPFKNEEGKYGTICAK